MSIIDPDYTYHQTASQFYALLAFELTNNELILFNFTNFAVDLIEWYDVIIDISSEYNCGITNEQTNMIMDALQTILSYSIQLQTEIENLNTTMDDYLTKVEFYNQAMKGIGKQFLYEPGLPSRAYFKNIVCFLCARIMKTIITNVCIFAVLFYLTIFIANRTKFRNRIHRTILSVCCLCLKI